MEDPELVVVGSDMYEFEEDPSVIVSEKKMPYSQEEIYKFNAKSNSWDLYKQKSGQRIVGFQQ